MQDDLTQKVSELRVRSAPVQRRRVNTRLLKRPSSCVSTLGHVTKKQTLVGQTHVASKQPIHVVSTQMKLYSFVANFTYWCVMSL